MCAITFKDELWTTKIKPTHRVVAARGRHHEVVGYFVAKFPDEIKIAMEVFDGEYGDHFDRLMAIKLESAQPQVAVFEHRKCA